MHPAVARTIAIGEILVISLAAALIYSNSLHGGFVIDDGSAIRTNMDLRPETPLSQLLINDYWGRPLATETSVKSYRPLTVLSFRVNFALHGLDVPGYHIGNVALHACCTALVGLLMLRLVAPGDATAARVAALAFAVHPVHVEAVASIVGRAELLCCLFYLPSILCHAAGCQEQHGGMSISGNARSSGETSSSSGTTSGGSSRSGSSSSGSGSHRRQHALRSILSLLLSALLGVLATASKETGITAYAAASAIDALRVLNPRTTLRARALFAARCTLFGGLTLALFLVSQALRGEHLSPHFSFVDNPLPSLPTPAWRAMSILHVHVRYARLLLWPRTLSADYSFDCVPAVTELVDGRNLGSAALYAVLFWSGVSVLRAYRAAEGGATGDACGEVSATSAATPPATAAAAAPVAAGISRAAKAEAHDATGAIADTTGATDAIAAATMAATTTGSASVAAATFIATDCTSGAGATDDASPLVSAGPALVLLLLPMLPASHVLLGIGTLVAERLLYIPSVGYCALLGIVTSAALRRAGQYEFARGGGSGGSSDSGCSSGSSGGSNGVGSGAQGRWARRLIHLAIAITLSLGSARTWTRNADWSDSNSITAATARACPGSAKAQVSKGTMHLQHGQMEQARLAFRAALTIHPQYPDALYWLGRVAFMQDRLDDAEPLLLAALSLNGGLPEAHLFAALCATRRADDVAAARLLARAHELAPHNAEIVRDYGAILLRVGKPRAALPILERAVALLAQLYELGDGSAHSRGSLASAHVKLAAVLLNLNLHARCTEHAQRAAALEPKLQAAVSGLAQLCERGLREGIDTSNVRIDLSL